MNVKVKLKVFYYAEFDETGLKVYEGKRIGTLRETVGKIAKELGPNCAIYKVETLEGVAAIPTDMLLTYMKNEEEK